MYFWRPRSRKTDLAPAASAGTRFPAVDVDYEPPLMVVSGDVQRITLGSSPSGNRDMNGQYYW